MTLAELAGDRLSVSLISKIERGLVQPSLATLTYLAERLDLPLGDLLGGGAEALIGLARLADAAGEPATARNLYQQAVAELGSAASPLRRQTVLARRADDLAAAGDALGALRAAASAPELGAIARAAALRAE